MNKRNEHQVEKQYNWDYERLKVRKPVKSPRVVVSVAFKREDFEIVSEYAERSHKKVSEFIREAALEKVLGRESVLVIQGSGGAEVLWLRSDLPNTTQVQAPTTVREKSDSVFTLYS